MTGMLAAVTVFWFEIVLFTRAGCSQGFTLEHTPTCGAGIVRFSSEPGWAMFQ
jgi:hypothetical protein